MDRHFKLLALVSTMPGLAAPAAMAGIPDCPALSTIPNIIASPGGTIPTTFTIVCSSGPVGGATVELRYAVAGDEVACWCPGQDRPIVSGTTDQSGQVTFHVSGGGCLNPQTIEGGIAIEVFVNGLPFKQIGQVSSDLISTTSPPCSVTLGDAVNFTGPLSTNSYSFCHDLNTDNAVGLADAVLLTGPVSAAASCP